MVVIGAHQSRPVLVSGETAIAGDEGWKTKVLNRGQVVGHSGGSQGLMWTVIPDKGKSVSK